MPGFSTSNTYLLTEALTVFRPIQDEKLGKAG